MTDDRIIPRERREFVLSLLAAEILTRRGDLGPLARVFQPRPKPDLQPGEGLRPRREGKREGK